MNRFFAFFVLLLTFSTSALANTQGDGDASRQFVSELGRQAVEAVSKKDSTPQQKRQALGEIINNSVDFDWVGKYVLGRFNRSATEEQRREFINLYRQFLLLTYTSRVEDYTSVGFKILNVRAEGDGQQVVNTQIERPGKAPISVNYRVYNNNGAPKIVDMVVEGVSLLTTQRSEFSSVLNQGGIAKLNELLSKKINGLSK